jgi:sec-independent protein translocase protein TatA
MLGGLEPWHIIVIVAVLFLLFGYRKLPSATKSIAQSLKIFRDETKGLRGGDDAVDAPVGEHQVGDNTGTGALAAPTVLAAPVAVTAVAAQPVAAAQAAPVTVPAPVVAATPAPVAAALPVPAPAPVVVPEPQPVAAAPVVAPPAEPVPAGSLAPRPGAYASGGPQSH